MSYQWEQNKNRNVGQNPILILKKWIWCKHKYAKITKKNILFGCWHICKRNCELTKLQTIGVIYLLHKLNIWQLHHLVPTINGRKAQIIVVYCDS